MTSSNELSSKRERAKRLIRDLLSKTVTNGATEAEATAAMEKASELMLQYDVTFEDAQQIQEEIYGALKKFYARGSMRRRSWHEAIDLALPIARFTGTKVWREPVAGNIIYFGRKQDTEVAHYFLDLLTNCCETEWQKFRRISTITKSVGVHHGDTSIRGRKSFLRGMISRLEERLNFLANSRRATLQSHATSNALVVLKDQIVKEKFGSYCAEKGLRLKTSAVQRRSYSTGSGNYKAGVEAGDRVNLSSGVGSSNPAGRITGPSDQ